MQSQLLLQRQEQKSHLCMSFLGFQSQPMIGELPEGVSESPKCLSCGTPIRSGALGEVLDMAPHG